MLACLVSPGSSEGWSEGHVDGRIKIWICVVEKNRTGQGHRLNLRTASSTLSFPFQVCLVPIMLNLWISVPSFSADYINMYYRFNFHVDKIIICCWVLNLFGKLLWYIFFEDRRHRQLPVHYYSQRMNYNYYRHYQCESTKHESLWTQKNTTIDKNIIRKEHNSDPSTEANF